MNDASEIIGLFCSGNYAQAAKIFSECHEHLPAKQSEHIEGLLALIVASGQDAVLDFFPDDSRLKSQSGVVGLAIAALCEGNDVELSGLLKKIPYRSPYRDLRLILSGLSQSEVDRPSAAENLARVSQDSPFKPAAVFSELAVAADFDLDKLAGLSLTARSFISIFRGLDQRILNFVDTVLPADGSAELLFNTLLKNSLLPGNEYIRAMCFSLLPLFPSGLNQYQEVYGTLSEFDRAKLGALSFEKRNDFENAAWEWEYASDVLADQLDSEQTTLLRAIILRRAAECVDRIPGIFFEDAERFLEQSLKYDPDDLPTYLSLFKRYKESADEDLYRECVERATKQFPEDSEVLMAAIELAIERSAFKKAAKFAKILLKRDSINSRARRLLIKAHLSHARKQILKSRFDLGGREIDEAEKFERPGSPSGLVPLHRGILEFARKDEVSGDQMIEQSCQILASYQIGYFRAAVEMGRLGLSANFQKRYDSLLRNTALRMVDKKTFIGLIREIQHYIADPEVDVSLPVTALKKYISSSVLLDFSREEMELACNIFEDLGSYQHLIDFASRALELWPDDPIFVYYFIFSKTKGFPGDLTPTDSERLRKASEKATEQTDIHTARRLIDYLDSAQYFPGFGAPQFMAEEIGNAFDSMDDSEVVDDGFPNGNQEPDHSIKQRQNQRRRKDPFTLDLFDD